MLTVEVGGSSTQAIQFEHPAWGTIVPLDGHRTDPWLLAAPGLVEGDRVRGAHHLGWLDVQASRELRMASPPLLSMNDAEAAALGEWWLCGQPQGMVLYIGLGTGIGAAAVAHGALVPVELSHRIAFGPKRWGGCGRMGCLDAQIGGHALPTPLGTDDIETIVNLLGVAINQQDIITP
jgi:predicted NBD/HSP70 family sugar kinase